MTDTTKEDELLSKTMQKPFKKKASNHGGGGYQRSRRGRSCSRSRRRSRSRSRARSRSPRRDRNAGGSGSGRQPAKPKPKPRGGNNNSNSNNNRKDDYKKKEDSNKDSNKSKDPEFSSPLSSFFTAPALLLLPTLGFVGKSFPTLDKLPLGGRLRLCILNWRKVCSNFWVLDVVSCGY